jgi:hypothetical protein
MSKETNFQDAERQTLRRLVPKCEVCGLSTASEHVYARLATAISGDVAANRVVLERAERGEWAALCRESSWDHESDNFEWFALRCADGGLHVVTVFAPFELFQSAQTLLTRQVHHPDEVAQVMACATEWYPL